MPSPQNTQKRKQQLAKDRKAKRLRDQAADAEIMELLELEVKPGTALRNAFTEGGAGFLTFELLKMAEKSAPDDWDISHYIYEAIQGTKQLITVDSFNNRQ